MYLIKKNHTKYIIQQQKTKFNKRIWWPKKLLKTKRNLRINEHFHRKSSKKSLKIWVGVLS